LKTTNRRLDIDGFLRNFSFKKLKIYFFFKKEGQCNMD